MHTVKPVGSGTDKRLEEAAVKMPAIATADEDAVRKACLGLLGHHLAFGYEPFRETEENVRRPEISCNRVGVEVLPRGVTEVEKNRLGPVQEIGRSAGQYVALAIAEAAKESNVPAALGVPEGEVL